jgi:hypothetical protein
MVSSTKMGQRRDRDQQKPALLGEDRAVLMPGQRAPQSDARSERRTEDVAQKDGQNRSHDDGHDVPEAQLLPTVVNDQHRQQSDRRVDHPVHTNLQTTDPRLWCNRHHSTLRSVLMVGKPRRNLTLVISASYANDPRLEALPNH